MNYTTISLNSNGRSSVVAKLWFLFAILFVFSLWLKFRPNFLGFSIHPSFLLLPIIGILALAQQQIYPRSFGRIFMAMAIFVNVVLISAILNDNCDWGILTKWVISFSIICLAALTFKSRQEIVVALKYIVLSIGLICFYGILSWQGIGYAINPFSYAT